MLYRTIIINWIKVMTTKIVLNVLDARSWNKIGSNSSNM